MTPEMVVNEFSIFLNERAKALYTRSISSDKPTPPLPTKPWLMAEIGTLLEADDWQRADVAKLAALFFFLLVGPES